MIHSGDFSDGDFKVFNNSVITGSGIMERYNNRQCDRSSYVKILTLVSDMNCMHASLRCF